MEQKINIDVKFDKHLYINGIISKESLNLPLDIAFATPIVETQVVEDDIKLAARLNNQNIDISHENGKYILNLDRHLKEKDRIELRVKLRSGEVYSQCEVLSSPIISVANGSWKDDTEGPNSVRVNVVLSSLQSDVITYYRLIVRSIWYDDRPENEDMQNELLEKQIITVANPLFEQPKYELFTLAKDAPFAIFSLQNQDSFSFDYPEYLFVNYDNPLIPKRKYKAEIELQRISKEYFLYLKTYMDSQNNTAFDNPIKVYSNVQNGFGCFSIYSSTIMPLSINN